MISKVRWPFWKDKSVKRPRILPGAVSCPSVLVEQHEKPGKVEDNFLQKAAIRALDRSSCDQQMKISTRLEILTAKRKLDRSRCVH